MTTQTNRRVSPLIIVLGLLVVSGAAATVWVLLVDDEEEQRSAAERAEQLRADERQRKLEAQTRKLKKVFGNQRALPEAPTPPPWKRPAPEPVEPAAPEELTHAQRVALKAAFRRFYSASELSAALRDGRAAETAREMSQRFANTFASGKLETSDGDIPVNGEVRQVIKRLNVVRDYTFNVLHAERPEGQEDLQTEMVEKVNENFKERFDALNRDYPFLGAKLVEP